MTDRNVKLFACSIVAAHLGAASAAALPFDLDLSPELYAEHVSHASQHFGADRTNYGWDSVNFGVTLEHGDSGPFATVAEGYTLESGAGRVGLVNTVPVGTWVTTEGGALSTYVPVQENGYAEVQDEPGVWAPTTCSSGQRCLSIKPLLAHGALNGPREVASARLGWKWITPLPWLGISTYGEYVSHLTDVADNYTTVNVAVTFRPPGSGFFATFAEGYNLNAHSTVTIAHPVDGPFPGSLGLNTEPSYGALAGPRETFSARIGWSF
jgi:hypothetical protein